MFDILRIEPSGRRVRAFVGGTPVADSSRVLMVWEPKRLPVYYFPVQDVRSDLLKRSARLKDRWDVEVNGRRIDDAAWASEHPPLKDHVAFRWNKMDAWYEEDDEVFVHPRDPYHRVDVLDSSRHVKVSVEGQVVAETSRPRLLFETGLPTRYYIPKVDVRMDLLQPTSSTTACPYKGRASYWSVKIGDNDLEDLVWSYPAPIPECSKIENLICFYNEKVDIEVDGELQERPKTPWS
jgi:uncharacterized protein (DUF427 family)